MLTITSSPSQTFPTSRSSAHAALSSAPIRTVMGSSFVTTPRRSFSMTYPPPAVVTTCAASSIAASHTPSISTIAASATISSGV